VYFICPGTRHRHSFKDCTVRVPSVVSIFTSLPLTGLGGIQRQARESISGPGRDSKAKLMSFNRTQSRAVIGLLTGHNTLGRHLHIHGLTDSPLCRQCGMEEETFVNVRFWPLSDTCIWDPFFWSRWIFRV